MNKYHVANFLINLKQTFISKKFIEFSVLGVVNTFTNALFSSIASNFMQQNAAAVFGYVVSLTIGFFLNCRITFKSHPTLSKYIRFCSSYIPNFIIYFLVTYITLNTLEMTQFWGTVLAVLAGGPITFVIIKFYAFGKK
ncbi:MAG: GtrA family protein [Clostridia bacterium]|nr:GtrA family protein [Clostridia bacterium]